MRSSHLTFRIALLLLVTAGVRAADVEIQVNDQKQVPIAELAVWLTPLDRPTPPAPSNLHATVKQQDEEFTPYISIVRVGTEVAFPNLDDVQHHVYSLSRPAQFEIPLHGGNQTESVVLDKPGIIPVGCNIHDWMISHIVVVDTPWFGQTDADGRLRLTDLPAGRYTLEAWHPRLRKSHSEEITLAAGTPLTVPLELKLRPDRRLRRAPDAGGHGY
ncbi:carboxypeptidase regulatory-like domain-containing protein [Actomonas aquatica]|uniref:Carboxypeptidase regulatory-like domain-containing protein n=1 Tax=Actomonas aquatica TaxID=2866162 RepID=A0ABZ1C4G6_9BACT|nr:carboxypeptidase regulatory-like domain-containing protein [Opitutus sp. WL0086]WRQ86609.1 carboxypeptidase regulatory-like domain-containing protein [Opitutus sp. WL0086]